MQTKVCNPFSFGQKVRKGWKKYTIWGNKGKLYFSRWRKIEKENKINDIFHDYQSDRDFAMT